MGKKEKNKKTLKGLDLEIQIFFKKWLLWSREELEVFGEGFPQNGGSKRGGQHVLNRGYGRERMGGAGP